MSPIIDPKPSQEELRHLFRYGWRDVTRLQPDGSVTFQNVPLTLEDILYPELGDYIVEGPMHGEIRMYLADVFRSRLVHDPSAYVLSHCGVYWNHPDFDHHAPDITVLTGLTNPQEIRRQAAYSVKKFGQFPCMVIEIVSRNLRDNDIVTKFREYHMLGVPLYVIIDREKSDVDWKIVPYQHTPQQYVELPTDDRGRFWIELLGIWLGVENKQVVCYDGETDRVIGNYLEISRELEILKQRADVEKQRADAEKRAREDIEAKIKELEAEIASLRGQ